MSNASESLRHTWSRKAQDMPVFSPTPEAFSESLPIFSVLGTSQKSRCPQSFVLSILSLGLTVIYFPSFSAGRKSDSTLASSNISIATNDDKSKGQQRPLFSGLLLG